MQKHQLMFLLALPFAVAPHWTTFACTMRYGRTFLRFPWWWYCSRMFLNVLMLYAVVFVVLGIIYEIRGIEAEEPWARTVTVFVGAIAVFAGMGRIFIPNTPKESTYPESWAIGAIWCLLAVGTVVRYLQKKRIHRHLLNGLGLGMFGALLTRFLKNWI